MLPIGYAESRKPLARLRRARGQLSITNVVLDPYSPAIPSPTTARNANSDQYPQDRPQSRLPTENSRIEVIIAGLRPNRSPSAPSASPPNQRDTNAALTSVAAWVRLSPKSLASSVSTSVMSTKSKPSSR